MAFTLPNLPYDFNALEPFIDEATMRVHHGGHHKAYVTNLNTALEAHPDLASKGLDELVAGIATVPESVRGPVRNNGGGHYNHSMFWASLAPAGKGGGGQPSGALAEAIKSDLGGFDAFKDAFTKAAMGRFGSGWAWLSLKDDGKLCVCSTPNQDSPLMKGVVDCPGKPFLGLDVWEHAYYLKYQNRRAEYVTAFWNIINWKSVEERFSKAK